MSFDADSAQVFPLVLTSGISGKRPGEKAFPRFTSRLLGRLSIDETGLHWRPLLPWRRPSQVDVRWADISKLDYAQGGAYVVADGWERLMFAPSGARRFVAALEASDLTLHRNGAFPRRVIATRGEQVVRWWENGPSQRR